MQKSDINKVMQETGMDLIQATRHVDSRNHFVVQQKYQMRIAQIESEKEKRLVSSAVE